jgi:hypothetical protein
MELASTCTSSLPPARFVTQALGIRFLATSLGHPLAGGAE